MTLRTIAFAVALLFGGVAYADNTTAAVVIDDVPKFLDYQRDLRDDLKSSKFRHLGNTRKKELLAAQDELFVLLEGKRSIKELNHEQQTQVYNAQHVVASIITDAELDRPICKRQKRVGSNMSETVCTTKRRRDEHYNELQRNLRSGQNCGGPDCSANR